MPLSKKQQARLEELRQNAAKAVEAAKQPKLAPAKKIKPEEDPYFFTKHPNHPRAGRKAY